VALLDEKIKELLLVRNMLLQGAKICSDGCTAEPDNDNCPILVSDNFDSRVQMVNTL
jgi:hypothetical protein